MRNETIDFTKGILIILVIIGHFLFGSLDDNILRYSIYFFHMPLFIGVSGFLFYSKKLQETSISFFLIKYFKRIIIPWFIAIIFFAFYLNGYFLNAANRNFILIYSFITPYFHLWFISGFIFWISITFLFLKLKLKPKQILIIGFFISVVFYFINLNIESIKQIKYLGRILEIITYSIRLRFYFFFTLGLYLKTNSKKNFKYFNIKHLYLSLSFLFSMIILLFFLKNNFISFLLFYTFNTLLIILITLLFTRKSYTIKPINWIGKNSLGIYLWHVIPILLINDFFKEVNHSKIYFTTSIFELCFICVLFYISKIKYINKIFFGF